MNNGPGNATARLGAHSAGAERYGMYVSHDYVMRHRLSGQVAGIAALRCYAASAPMRLAWQRVGQQRLVIAGILEGWGTR